MTREEFVRQRQEDWARFEALLSFAEDKRQTRFRIRGPISILLSLFSMFSATRSVPNWTGEDLSEFSSLFRAICYDLSLARSRDFGLGLNRYLNNLVARGHNAFYRGQPGSFGRMFRFFLEEFPWLLRQNIRYFWVALSLFVLPGLIAGLLLYLKPELGSRLFTEEMMQQFADMHSGETRKDHPSAYMTSMYIFNNVGIAFRCFASGALCGIGTVCTLVFNSLFIGGVTGYLVALGKGHPFFTFAISHGSFELTAIVVAGAAGLILGHAIVHPGSLTRAESVRVRGRVAVKLALGAGGMLAVAAFIEGFWSPSPIPGALKYFVGTILWIVVFCYLAFAGRRYDPTEFSQVEV